MLTALGTLVLLCLAFLVYTATGKWGRQSAKGAMYAAAEFQKGNLSHLESTLVTHCAFQMARLKVAQDFTADPDQLRSVAQQWWEGLRAELPARVMVRWEQQIRASGDAIPSGIKTHRLLLEAMASCAQQH